MCHHSPKCVSVSLCFDVCDNTPAGHLHASLVSPGVSQHEGVAPARGRNDGRGDGHTYAKSTVVIIHLFASKGSNTTFASGGDENSHLGFASSSASVRSVG